MKYLLPLACAVLAPIAVSGQSYLNDTGKPAYATTIPVENGYIDLSNGNLHLEFPLASIPQRGELGLTEKLTYDSRIWEGSSTYGWWPTNAPGAPYGSAGWGFVSGTPYVTFSSTPIGSTYNECLDMTGQVVGSESTYQFNLIYIDESGTYHPTNAVETDYYDEGCPYWAPNWVSTVTYTAGYATDGSGYTIGVDPSGTSYYALDAGGNEVAPLRGDSYGNYLWWDTHGNTIDDTGRIPVITTQHSSAVTYYDVLAPNGTAYPSEPGTRVRYIVTTAPITVSTAFGSGDWSGTLNPVSNIQLPDGSSYSFNYDVYGELNSVQLPTGGTIQYTYTNFTDSTGTANRWLHSHQVGSDPSETFTQAVVSGCTGCQQVTYHKPSGDETVYSQQVDNGAWTTGITTYTGSAATGTQLSQTTASNSYTASCSSCYTGNYVSTSFITTELFPSGTGSPIYTQTLTANYLPGMPSYTKTWDYMSSASLTTPPSGTPASETDYTYTNQSAPWYPHKIHTVKVLNSSGAQAALTTYGYTSTPSMTISGITQHGSPLATPQYLQTVTQDLNTNTGASPVTTYSMDDTGQVVSVQDANGNSATTISYTCANSLPEHVKPLGSTTYETDYSYIDCNSGAIWKIKDPNDAANSRAGTVYSYEATGGRLQGISYPDGGSTTYTYAGSTGTYPYRQVDTTVATSSTSSITTTSIVDTFGRPSQTQQNGITSTTSYDSNGRVSCVENPHLSTSSATDGSTCIVASGSLPAYDGLDRPLTEQLPDSSLHHWTYVLNTTTETDEASNSTLRAFNALGQLATVVEAGPLTTNYTYDGLGNLTTINQLGNGSTDTPRVRTFTYDSLSRLVCAAQPEIGGSATCPTSPSSTSSGGIPTSYTAGTLAYGYDKNGNQIYRRDPRSNSEIDTAFDSLNRLTDISYTDGQTPNQHYHYDQTSVWMGPQTNTIGRLSQAITDPDRRYFGSGSAPTCNAQTSATANYNAAYGNPLYCTWTDQLFSYDPMGRQIAVGMAPPSEAGWSSHTLYMSYDLAGNLAQLQYPDGRVIVNAYDSNGELCNVVAYTGSTVNCTTTSSANYFSSTNYFPTGALMSATLGNGVTHSYNLNSRQQPTEIVVQNSGGTKYMDKQYAYTSVSSLPCSAPTPPGNNGNILQIADALNSNRSQKFGYDSLNRIIGFANGNSSMTQCMTTDHFGNMTVNSGTLMSTLSFDANNRITSGGYSYDAAGNLVTAPVLPSGTQQSNYDPSNRVWSLGVPTPGTPSALTAFYTYSATGERMRKDASGTWTEYTYFNGVPIAERAANGAWSDYIYANGEKIARADSAQNVDIRFNNDSCSGCGGTPVGGGDRNLYVYGTFGISPSNSYISFSQSTPPWSFTSASCNGFSGGNAVLLCSGDMIDSSAPSPWAMAIGAWGTPDYSVYPHMQVYLNNELAGEWDVTGTAATYVATADYYYSADHLGTTTVVTNSQGSLMNDSDYYPYGSENAVTTADNNHFKYTTYERDSESRNDYAMARYFSSDAGRFNSPDPYLGSIDPGNPQSLNRYSYVLNNPLIAVDPTGLNEDFCGTGATIGCGYYSDLDYANLYIQFTSQGYSLPAPYSSGGIYCPVTGYCGYATYIPTPVGGPGVGPGSGSGSGSGGGPGAGPGNGSGGSSGHAPIPRSPLPVSAPSNQQIIRDSLNQPRLHSCSKSLFGNANALSASNAPSIQYRSPSQLQAMGHSPDVAGTNNPATNTAYFNSSVFTGNLLYVYYQSNYLHEAGNILSFKLYGNFYAKGNMFVGPNETRRDPDSGASFESCIFGQRMQIP